MLDVIKKILCVSNDFGPRAGGIESFIIGLITRLPPSSTTIYTSAQGDTRDYDAAWLTNHGVRVIRDRARVLLPTPRVSRTVARLVESEGFEIVVFGAAAPLALMAHSLRQAGARRIVALTHGHELWWAKLFPFRLAMRRIGSRTDALTYLGEYTRSAIASVLTPHAAAAMVKIAPGIDTEHFAPMDSSELRESLGLTDKKIIISVGRLVHRKGQDRLIQAMVAIVKEIPKAHLLLVGEGPYEAHLRDLVRKYSLKDHITFIGRIQYADLPAYICVGEIFAMPARSRLFGLEVEGLGIVYLEASACGLPVIAGRSGGAPDALIDGTTGLVIDGTDNAAIAEAVIDLLSHPQRSKEMGQAGRNWILEKWRWQIWAERFEQLINK